MGTTVTFSKTVKVISLKFPKLNWPPPAQSRVPGHPAKFWGQPQWFAVASATWQHHPWSCLPDCCYASLEATPGGLQVHQISGQSWWGALSVQCPENIIPDIFEMFWNKDNICFSNITVIQKIISWTFWVNHLDLGKL